MFYSLRVRDTWRPVYRYGSFPWCELWGVFFVVWYPIFGASLSLVWDGLSNFGRGFLFLEEFCTSFWISNSFLLPSLLKSADILPTKHVSKLILGKIPLMFRIDCFNEFRPCFHFSHSFLGTQINLETGKIKVSHTISRKFALVYILKCYWSYI